MGEGLLVLVGRWLFRLGVEQIQPKIGQDGSLRGVDDVAGLQMAVAHPLAVGVGEGFFGLRFPMGCGRLRLQPRHDQQYLAQLVRNI